MILHKIIPWEFEKTKYDIRIYYDKNIISIVVFKENRPANGFRYQIQVPKNIKIEKVLNSDRYSHLIGYCKQDVVDGRWNLSGLMIQSV